LSELSPRSAARSRYCHASTPHTSGIDTAVTSVAFSRPPLRTRSTEVVSSTSANASRSLVTSTHRQPLSRAVTVELARTSSASYAGGTTTGNAAERRMSGAATSCETRSSGLSGRWAL
jgi:hypothetical protein